MSEFQIVAAAIVGVLAVARITRLIVFDTYPPMAWLRSKWDAATHDGSWSELVHCGYCAAPYVAAVVLAAGEFSDYHYVWWLICGWLAASYVAAIVVRFDGSD